MSKTTKKTKARKLVRAIVEATNGTTLKDRLTVLERRLILIQAAFRAMKETLEEDAALADAADDLSDQCLVDVYQLRTLPTVILATWAPTDDEIAHLSAKDRARLAAGGAR